MHSTLKWTEHFWDTQINYVLTEGGRIHLYLKFNYLEDKDKARYKIDKKPKILKSIEEYGFCSYRQLQKNWRNWYTLVGTAMCSSSSGDENYSLLWRRIATIRRSSTAIVNVLYSSSMTWAVHGLVSNFSITFQMPLEPDFVENEFKVVIVVLLTLEMLL